MTFSWPSKCALTLCIKKPLYVVLLGWAWTCWYTTDLWMLFLICYGSGVASCLLASASYGCSELGWAFRCEGASQCEGLGWACLISSGCKKTMVSCWDGIAKSGRGPKEHRWRKKANGMSWNQFLKLGAGMTWIRIDTLFLFFITFQNTHLFHRGHYLQNDLWCSINSNGECQKCCH